MRITNGIDSSEKKYEIGSILLRDLRATLIDMDTIPSRSLLNKLKELKQILPIDNVEAKDSSIGKSEDVNGYNISTMIMAIK